MKRPQASLAALNSYPLLNGPRRPELAEVKHGSYDRKKPAEDCFEDIDFDTSVAFVVSKNFFYLGTISTATREFKPSFSLRFGYVVALVEHEAPKDPVHEVDEERCQTDEDRDIEEERRERPAAIVHEDDQEDCLAGETVEEFVGGSTDFLGEVRDSFAGLRTSLRPGGKLFAVDVDGADSLEHRRCIRLVLDHLVEDGLKCRPFLSGELAGVEALCVCESAAHSKDKHEQGSSLSKSKHVTLRGQLLLSAIKLYFLFRVKKLEKTGV